MHRLFIINSFLILIGCTPQHPIGNHKIESLKTDTLFIGDINYSLFFNDQNLFDTTYTYEYSGMCLQDYQIGTCYSNKKYSYLKSNLFDNSPIDSLLNLTIFTTPISDKKEAKRIDSSFLTNTLNDINETRKSVGSKEINPIELNISSILGVPFILISYKEKRGDLTILNSISKSIVNETEITTKFIYMGEAAQVDSLLTKHSQLIESIDFKRKR